MFKLRISYFTFPAFILPSFTYNYRRQFQLSVKPIILSRTEIAERFPLILERYIAKKEHEAQFGNREDLDRNSDGEAPEIVSSVKKVCSKSFNAMAIKLKVQEKILSSSRKRTVVKKHETDRRNSGRIEGKPTKRNAAAEGKPKTVFKVSSEVHYMAVLFYSHKKLTTQLHNYRIINRIITNLLA